MTTQYLPSSLTRLFKRRWMVHLSWFVALVVTCATCAMLGGHTLNWGVSSRVWQDKRQAHFATISSSLAEMEQNDIAYSEGLAIDRIRTALIALAAEDDGWLCTHDESAALTRAGIWFDTHPDHRATHELRPFIAEGLGTCKNRTWPRSATTAGIQAQSQFIALPVVATNRGLVSST